MPGRRASNALVTIRRRHCMRCGRKLWVRRWCRKCMRSEEPRFYGW